MVRAVVVRDREVDTECVRELDEMIECASSSSSELGMLEFMRESGGRIESAVVVVSTVLARVFLERLQKVKDNQKKTTHINTICKPPNVLRCTQKLMRLPRRQRIPLG